MYFKTSAKSRRYCLYVQDFVILIIRFLLFCILTFYLTLSFAGIRIYWKMNCCFFWGEIR